MNNENIYRAPGSNLGKSPSKPGRSVLAIVFALCTIFLGGFIVTKSLDYAVQNAWLQDETFVPFFSDSLRLSTFGILSFILFSPLYFIGGYVCAKISRQKFYRDATILSVIIAAPGVLLSSIAQENWLETAIIFATYIPIIFLGGFLQIKNAS